MLMVTLAALETILQLMHAEGANGLRLHVEARRFSPTPAVELEAAPLPEVDDIVLELEGARLYLDPETHKLLDDKILDTDLTDDEPVFIIHQQPDPVRARPLNEEGRA